MRARPGVAPPSRSRLAVVVGEAEEGSARLVGALVYWIDDVDRFAATHRAVCALGTTTRRRLIEEAAAHGLRFTAIVHPRAHASARNEFGEGSVASVNVVVAVNAHIGLHVILSRGASIGHDTVVGDYVTVGPGVNVADCAASATAVPPNVEVRGVPARVVKEGVEGR